MPNRHVGTISYVAEVNNPNFDIWRPKYPWQDSKLNYTDPYMCY